MKILEHKFSMIVKLEIIQFLYFCLQISLPNSIKLCWQKELLKWPLVLTSKQLSTLGINGPFIIAGARYTVVIFWLNTNSNSRIERINWSISSQHLHKSFVNIQNKSISTILQCGVVTVVWKAAQICWKKLSVKKKSLKILREQWHKNPF